MDNEVKNITNRRHIGRDIQRIRVYLGMKQEALAADLGVNQRDTIAVRKMVGGFIKLLYPDGEYTKEELEEVLKISLEMRRRVKEQLKKLGGMEFYDVNFSYIDNETFEEFYVSVPEQGGGKLIPEGMCKLSGRSGFLAALRHFPQRLRLLHGGGFYRRRRGDGRPGIGNGPCRGGGRAVGRLPVARTRRA